MEAVERDTATSTDLAPDQTTESVHYELHELGHRAGSEEAQEWGRLANENPPILRTHDRYGNRIDFVEYHPAYHQLMATAIAHGLHATPWADSKGGAHVRRAAKVITWYQAEPGQVCPISMTYSAIPALRHEPKVAERWEPCLSHQNTTRATSPRNKKLEPPYSTP